MLHDDSNINEDEGDDFLCVCVYTCLTQGTLGEVWVTRDTWGKAAKTARESASVCVLVQPVAMIEDDC